MDDYIYDEENHFYDHDTISSHDDDNDEAAPLYEFTAKHIFNYCVKPSVVQIVVYGGTFLLWNLVFRVTTQIVKVPWFVLHWSSIINGGILLYLTIGLSSYYLVVYSILLYLVLCVTKLCRIKKYGHVMGLVAILFLVACELYANDPKVWHQIRGTQMIVAMKLISIGFDVDSGRIERLPNIVETLGYTMCPGNSIVGPWVPYTEYISIFNKPKWNFQWVLRITLNFILAITFLVLSNCIIPSVIPDDSWKWFTAYRNALSFRASHYFISFLSQSSIVAAGFGKESDSYFFGFQVTKPVLIEIPRSIVQVVVAWNIPMHNWLKFYVFRNLKSYGTFVSIFTTYAVSALLHGLNFQLSAVLLSLGFYTFVEYRLRLKLANIFNACILPNRCRKNCPHELKSDHPYIILTNIIFGLLAVIHLIYLGVMFEASTIIQEEGFSLSHALNKWKSLDFTSHWIAGISYIFYLLI